MVSKKVITGEFCHHDEPNWQPLYDLVGVKLADWFMWMCATELADGVRVHSYKHITTREHFHLAVDGRAFEYIPSHGTARSTGGMRSISSSTRGRSSSGPDDRDRLALIRARGAAGPRVGARRRKRPQEAQPTRARPPDV